MCRAFYLACGDRPASATSATSAKRLLQAVELNHAERVSVTHYFANDDDVGTAGAAVLQILGQAHQCGQQTCLHRQRAIPM